MMLHNFETGIDAVNISGYQINAISLTLISKIGNHFSKKQQERNRNQPEWNSIHFLFI